jgi:hypothetical protein
MCILYQDVSAESLAMRGLRQHRRTHKPASLSFLAPTRVSVLGSYSWRTMTRSDCVVDVGVEMPAECFHDRDLKTYVYADKRSLYLGVLAKHLEGHAAVSSVKFEAFGHRVEKPVLLLQLGKLLRPAPIATRVRCILVICLCGSIWLQLSNHRSASD